jgi:hypothetical protein
MLFCEQAAEIFTNAAVVPEQRFLLVDAAATSGLNVQAALKWAGPAIDVLTLSAVDWRDSASPVLLTVPQNSFTSEQSRAWMQVAERWRYANALTVIESPVVLAALAPALHERMKVVLEGGLSMMVRLQDNRVLAALLQVLEPDQIDPLLGIAQRWLFADRRGEALVARNPRVQQPATPDTAGAHATPLRLSQNQENRLLRLSEPDQVIDILLSQQNEPLLALLPPQQHEQVAAHLDAADQLRIEPTSDRVAFCATGLVRGPQFHLRPPWQEPLQSVRRGDKRFGQVLEEVAVQA